MFTFAKDTVNVSMDSLQIQLRHAQNSLISMMENNIMEKLLKLVKEYVSVKVDS